MGLLVTSVFFLQVCLVRLLVFHENKQYFSNPFYCWDNSGLLTKYNISIPRLKNFSSYLYHLLEKNDIDGVEIP